MKLIVEPDDGLAPVLSAIRGAQKSIEIVIFRLDLHNVTRALELAVARGVTVHALIAHANSDGKHALRSLEERLLHAGAAVSRTAGDFLRYHGKMMIVDGHTLNVYAFNFTRLDSGSRSFGIVSSDARLVREAHELFECDAGHRPYVPSLDTFIVSPDNARERLAAFIHGAQRQLCIYDPRASDHRMLRLLEERKRNGVQVRIIGETASHTSVVAVGYAGSRMHVRAIVRDGAAAFVGSQSLRKAELDNRREIGVIIHDADVVHGIKQVFERDWAAAAGTWGHEYVEVAGHAAR